MTDLRTAAQQALEALEKLVVGTEYEEAVEAERAMEALRSALAEPTPLEDVVTHGSAWSKDGKRIDPMSVYAEPVEPVAWSHNLIDNIITHRPADIDRHPDRWTPLYPAPPQRKPLTEEEIQRVYREFMLYQDGLTPSGMQRVTRAIERAHNIKE